MGKQNLITPQKRDRLESIKRKMDNLSNRINIITTDLRKLGEEKKDLQNELKKLENILVKEEIFKISLNIKEQIISIEIRLKQIGKEIPKLEKLLWGIGEKKKGLMWEREKLDEKFRILLAGDVKF